MTYKAEYCVRGRRLMWPRTSPFGSMTAGRTRVDADAYRDAVTSAANPESPLADTWVSVALTYQGLKALGVPQESLQSFSWEFRQGMAARAKELGDIGESILRIGRSRWELQMFT